MFGGGWMIVNGGSVGSACEPGAVGREDVGRQPALVDRGLEVGRPVGLRQLRRRRVVVSVVSVIRLGPDKSNDPLVQRTNGVVVPPAGSAPGPSRSSRPAGSGALSARYRAPAARLASDVHAAGPARLAPSRARSVAVEALLLSVLAVRPGV